MRIKRALVSVSDKRGIVEFARGLSRLGIEIISTGGTAKLLQENGLKIISVADFTGTPEMFEGRVKTLHPLIYAGLLYKRGVKKHEEEARRLGIKRIDMVVANFYPFERVVAKKGVSIEEAIENIDIGGLAMVRAGAKNFENVVVVVEPHDYSGILKELRKSRDIARNRRLSLMAKAFGRTCEYDWAIGRYFSLKKEKEFPDFLDLRFQKVYPLRYGENPHQRGAAYRLLGQVSLVDAKIHSGKEMSYNNFLDSDAALGLISEFKGETATVIVKHTSPCGGAVGKTLAESYEKAFSTDPLSAFGGVIAFSKRVDLETAEAIGNRFVEIIIAPGYERNALRELKKRERRRILDVSNLFEVEKYRRKSFRHITGGMLYQDEDRSLYNGSKVVTKRKPTKEEMKGLLFGMKFAKHTKSNAVIILTTDQLVGVGAGQMSRIDACRIAIDKARRNEFKLEGTVSASDAFLPFRDVVDELGKAGITAIVQPGGSRNDEEVINAANGYGMAMVFTGIRHFRH